jgi:hypothetical protein
VEVAVDDAEEEGEEEGEEGGGEQCLQQTSLVNEILMEGQEEGDHQHSMMGIYELLNDKKVNGRGVWHGVSTAAEKTGQYLYYGSTKWWIGDKEDMEAEQGAGWMVLRSTALTPDEATETWQVWDDENHTWKDAPKTQAYACKEEEQEQEQVETLSGLGNCPSLIELVFDANPQVFEVERKGKNEGKQHTGDAEAQGEATDIEKAVAMGGPVGGGRLLGGLLHENESLLSLSLAACALAGVTWTERSHQGRVRLEDDGKGDAEYDEYDDEYGDEDDEHGDESDENMGGGGGGVGRGGRYVVASTRGARRGATKKRPKIQKSARKLGMQEKRRTSTMVWAGTNVQVSVWRGTYILGGITALAQGLAHNHTLVHLNLEDNCIGAKGLVAICAAMRTAAGKDQPGDNGGGDDEEDGEEGGNSTDKTSPTKARASSPLGRRLKSSANRKKQQEQRKQRNGSGNCALRVLNLSSCRLLWAGVGHRRQAETHSFKVKANLKKNNSFHKHWRQGSMELVNQATTKRILASETSGLRDDGVDEDGQTEEGLRRAGGGAIDYEDEYDVDMQGVIALAELLIDHAEGSLAILDLSSNELTGPNVDNRQAIDKLFDALQCNQTLRILDLRHNDVLDVVRHEELIGPGSVIRCCSHGKGVLLQTGTATLAANKLVEQLKKKELLAAHIRLKKENGSALRDDMVQTRDAIRRTADEAANTFLDLIG